MKAKALRLAGSLVALGILLLLAFAWKGRIVTLRPWPVSPEEARKAGLPGRVANTLALASLAPSSHNAQMWKVRVLSDTELLVMTDESRLLPAVDPDRREALVSIGAFLENLPRGASTQGLEAGIEILAESPTDTLVARVTLAPGKEPAGPEVLESLLRRETFRGKLGTGEIPSETLEALGGTAPSRWTWFAADTPEAAWIREALEESNRAQAARDDAQEELADWIRFSPGESARRRDGLTPAGMGIPRPLRAFMAFFFDKKDVTGKSFREAGVKKAREQSRSCAGFLVLASPDGSARSALQAGRDLEALWLEATLGGVALHPMSQALEESPWKEQAASRLGIEGTVQMILRAGLAVSPPRPVSSRRPLAEFVERP